MKLEGDNVDAKLFASIERDVELETSKHKSFSTSAIIGLWKRSKSGSMDCFATQNI